MGTEHNWIFIVGISVFIIFCIALPTVFLKKFKDE